MRQTGNNTVDIYPVTLCQEVRRHFSWLYNQSSLIINIMGSHCRLPMMLALLITVLTLPVQTVLAHPDHSGDSDSLNHDEELCDGRNRQLNAGGTGTCDSDAACTAHRNCVLDVDPSDGNYSSCEVSSHDGSGATETTNCSGPGCPYCRLAHDFDCDGVPDDIEWETDGTNPIVPDNDEDGDLIGVGGGSSCNDNCPGTINWDQKNTDQNLVAAGDAAVIEDTAGDACDFDDDGDGVLDADEAANGTDILNPDSDGDGGSPFINEALSDLNDNCPAVSNSTQLNTDQNLVAAGDAAVIEDTAGDACDFDDDGDGVLDADEADNGTDILNPDSDGDGGSPFINEALSDLNDNCPAVSNPDQANNDKAAELANSLPLQGDACDPNMDGDATLNASDICPLNTGNTLLDCEHICWPVARGVPYNTMKQPTIDGVLNEGSLNNYENPDVGWAGAHRITLDNNAATVEHVAFQALRNKLNGNDFLYMSFEIKNDNTLDGDDRAMIAIRPQPPLTAPFSHRAHRNDDIRLVVYPNRSSPGDIELLKYSSGSWVVVDHSSVGVDIAHKTYADGTANAWNIEIKMPTTAGTNWPAFNKEFKFYVHVARVDTSASDELHATQFNWPDYGHLATGSVTDLVNGYQFLSEAWGVGTTDPVLKCGGVSLDRMDFGADDGSYTGDTSALKNIIKTSTGGSTETNRFVAKVKNLTTKNGVYVGANGINVTYRIANWGLPGSTEWALLTGKTQGTCDQTNPTCPVDMGAATAADAPATQDFILDWEVNIANANNYPESTWKPGFSHQCILAELDSTSNAIITSKSVVRNMDIELPASVYNREARISAVGYGKPADGSDKHQFILQSHTRAYKPVPIKKGKKSLAAATGLRAVKGEHDRVPADDVRGSISRMRWLIHGYRQTGNYIEINENRYALNKPIGSFGYIVKHEGDEVGNWKNIITIADGGSDLKKLGDGVYQLSVPEEGYREINTQVEAKEKSFWEKLCPWLVLIALGIII